VLHLFFYSGTEHFRYFNSWSWYYWSFTWTWLFTQFSSVYNTVHTL